MIFYKANKVLLNALVFFIAVAAYSLQAQQETWPKTTFRDLFDRSDFIGLVKITGMHYQEIDYLDESGFSRQTIATIYRFKVLDSLKESDQGSREFVSMGGKYPDGYEIVQTGEVHLRIGDEVLVHLAHNPLLKHRMQIIGSHPGGRHASVFLVETFEGEQVVLSLRSKAMLGDNRIEASFMQSQLYSEANVSALTPRVFNFQDLKTLYGQIDID